MNLEGRVQQFQKFDFILCSQPQERSDPFDNTLLANKIWKKKMSRIFIF
jgi:hypothetical protein